MMRRHLEHRLLDRTRNSALILRSLLNIFGPPHSGVINQSVHSWGKHPCPMDVYPSCLLYACKGDDFSRMIFVIPVTRMLYPSDIIH